MIALRRSLWISAAVIALLLAAAVDVQAQGGTKPPRVGDKAPDFTLPTHDGKSLTLSKLQGKRGAVLVFFATWCEPCMEEVPHVKALVEATRNEKVLVYGINVDQAEQVIQRFVKAKKINYRVLLDKGAKVTRQYGVVGIPWIVGVDAGGTIRFVGHGIPEGKARDALVKTLTAPLKNEG